jgi:tetratricopeptide (TPR) repeat protein
MIKKILFMLDLWRAYSLADTDYKKALFLLNKHIDEANNYKVKFPDYYILKGSLYYNLENYDEAQKNFEIATELLTQNEYYNLDEKKYLFSYIYNYLSNILYKKNNQDWQLFNELSKRKNFDIKHIGQNLINNFPF